MSGESRTTIRLHLGCGTNILPGWINIDCVARAPGVRTDIRPDALLFADESVDEILAEHVFEHFTFAEEGALWRECARVLRPGGRLTLEVPDFEWVCRTFLAAEDNFREFYIVGAADHYFGCGRDLGQRWGILQTMFFGNQNGEGQFHHSAYTIGKLRRLAELFRFSNASFDTVFNKGGQAIRATFIK